MQARSRIIDVQDPLELLAAASAPRALWTDGTTLIFHEGVAAQVTASGSDRARRLQQAMPRVDHTGPGPGPVWLGGFAFREDDGHGAWQAFPAARMTLGRRQVVCMDGQWTETRLEAGSGPEQPPSDALDGIVATDGEAWRRSVEAAVDAIRDGEVSKVVLARAAVHEPCDPLGVLHRLRSREPDGTMFYFEPVAGQVFLGTTPERLVRLRDGVVQTHALAGSAPRGRSVEQDEAHASALQGSQKDVLEHELVAAFLRERLAEAGVRRVEQGRRRIRRLGAVQHLETPITGRLESHILGLVAVLHPTPAVCGTPRRRSMHLIEALEPGPRGWYAGAVGWFDATGQGEFSVALRCALCLPAATYLFAGAGIVAGSQAQHEWDETATKMQSLEAAL